MTGISEILKEAVSLSASDIFIVSGTAVSYKVFGNVMARDEEIVMPADAERMISEIFGLADIKKSTDEISREMDFSFSFAGVGRFRVNVYRQRSTLAAVLRNVLFDLPDSSALNIPESIIGINENEITTIGVLIDKNLLRTIVVASSKPASIVCLIFDIKKYTPFTKF